MSYQVIALKYRPKTFEEIVGQKAVVQTLKNSISAGRLAHAYLFSGVRGVGKTTMARLLAKALNCVKGPTAEPCNACPACLEVAASIALDVLEIDGASNNSVDDVRELRETVRYAPSRDRHRVIIIDEVHMLSGSAFNALLKTLEEPPPHVIFIFATTEYRKVPVTILSRCQHFEFRRIGRKEIADHLRMICDAEQVKITPYAIDLLARLADGSLRDAQSALDQVIAYSGADVQDEDVRVILGVLDRDLLLGFVEKVASKDAAGVLGLIDRLVESGHDPAKFVSDLIGQLRDILLLKIIPDDLDQAGLAKDDATAMRPLAEHFSQEDLLRIIDAVSQEEARLRFSSQPRYLLEALAVRLCHLADLTPLEDLLKHFQEGESGKGISPAPRPSISHIAVPSPDREAAPTAPDAQETTAENVRAQVEAILERIHAERGALGGFLSHASFFDLEDGAFVISLPESKSMFRPSIERKEYLTVIANAVEAVLGRRLPVRVRLVSPTLAGGTNSVPSEGETQELRKKKLLEDANRSPVVKSFLDIFQGEITDIEEV